MVNYLNKFIPNLADISGPLTELMKRSVALDGKQQEAYDILISLIARSPVLSILTLINSDITVKLMHLQKAWELVCYKEINR
jgi:hypothetical protein